MTVGDAALTAVDTVATPTLGLSSSSPAYSSFAAC
jgi:hypothetical protein